MPQPGECLELLDGLFNDGTVDEILVSGMGEVFVSIDAVVRPSQLAFTPPDVKALGEALKAKSNSAVGVCKIGLRSAVWSVISPPVAATYTIVAKRRPRRRRMLGDFVDAQLMSGDIAKRLSECVRERYSIVVASPDIAAAQVVVDAIASLAPPGQIAFYIGDAHIIDPAGTSASPLDRLHLDHLDPVREAATLDFIRSARWVFSDRVASPNDLKWWFGGDALARGRIGAVSAPTARRANSIIQDLHKLCFGHTQSIDGVIDGVLFVEHLRAGRGATMTFDLLKGSAAAGKRPSSNKVERLPSGQVRQVAAEQPALRRPRSMSAMTGQMPRIAKPETGAAAAAAAAAAHTQQALLTRDDESADFSIMDDFSFVPPDQPPPASQSGSGFTPARRRQSGVHAAAANRQSASQLPAVSQQQQHYQLQQQQHQAQLAQQQAQLAQQQAAQLAQQQAAQLAQQQAAQLAQQQAAQLAQQQAAQLAQQQAAQLAQQQAAQLAQQQQAAQLAQQQQAQQPQAFEAAAPPDAAGGFGDFGNLFDQDEEPGGGGGLFGPGELDDVMEPTPNPRHPARPMSGGTSRYNAAAVQNDAEQIRAQQRFRRTPSSTNVRRVTPAPMQAFEGVEADFSVPQEGGRGPAVGRGAATRRRGKQPKARDFNNGGDFMQEGSLGDDVGGQFADEPTRRAEWPKDS